MFGAIAIIIFICGCAFHGFKNASFDGKSKRDAILNNEMYYMDWQGYQRRVDNEHKVCIHTTGLEYNWDTVDIDLKTGEVLRNYTHEQAKSISIQKQKYTERNIKEKEKAIKEEKLWYPAYDFSKVLCSTNGGFLYEIVWRRVSDDIILDKKRTTNKVLYDDKFGLVLWRDEKTYHKHYLNYCCNTIEKDKEYNWRCIRSKINQERYNMTEQEIEEYARSINAIL